MEGFQDFEARRKKKFDKQIDSNVMISSKGLDEGVDLWFFDVTHSICEYSDSLFILGLQDLFLMELFCI